MTPDGVHATRAAFFIANNPALCGESPSTSFIGEIRDVVTNSFKCFGSGNCTKIPCTDASAFNSSMILLSSC